MEPADCCIEYRLGGEKLFYHFSMFRRRMPGEKGGSVYCLDFFFAYARSSSISENGSVYKC